MNHASFMQINPYEKKSYIERTWWWLEGSNWIHMEWIMWRLKSLRTIIMTMNTVDKTYEGLMQMIFFT